MKNAHYAQDILGSPWSVEVRSEVGDEGGAKIRTITYALCAVCISVCSSAFMAREAKLD